MAPNTTAVATALFSGLLSPTLRCSLLLLRRHPHPHPFRFLSTTASSSSFTNTTASFDWSSDEENDTATMKKKPDTNSSPPGSIPPPFYDPFAKNRKQRSHDPTNLQEVFHRMRANCGLTEYAVKMFDGLSRDGLTHEALELFSVIKDTSSTMPDVVSHTAVLEAYADAGGHAKDLLRTFHRMLSSGVLPNAYTYAVLVKGLAREGSLPEARRYLLEMVAKGIRPNVGTCVAVLEAYVMADEKGQVEARALLVEMRANGFEFSPGEKAVREALRNTRGATYRAVMHLLFGS